MPRPNGSGSISLSPAGIAGLRKLQARFGKSPDQLIAAWLDQAGAPKPPTVVRVSACVSCPFLDNARCKAPRPAHHVHVLNACMTGSRAPDCPLVDGPIAVEAK